MITHVVVDLGEVLFGCYFGMEARISRALGVQITNHELISPELCSLFKGEITEDEFWLSQIARFHWQTEVRVLKRILRENLVEVRGTMEIIDELRSKGLILALFSDNSKEWVEHLRDTYGGFEWRFTHLFFSFTSHTLKNESQTYVNAIREMGAPKENILAIDDLPSNVQRWRDQGCSALQFTTAPELRRALKMFDLRMWNAECLVS